MPTVFPDILKQILVLFRYLYMLYLAHHVSLQLAQWH